jgi:hypothetical protein
MNTNQLGIAYRLGWDIGNHTVNHPDDIKVLDTDTRTYEYKENRDWIFNNGWTRGADHVCYPMGSFDNELIALLKGLGTKSARSTIYGISPTPVEDIYRLKTVAVGRDIETSWVNFNIDKAVQTGSDIIFMYHNVVNKPDKNNPEHAIYESTSKFVKTLDYVKKYRDEGKLDVKTISQWYNDLYNQ